MASSDRATRLPAAFELGRQISDPVVAFASRAVRSTHIPRVRHKYMRENTLTSHTGSFGNWCRGKCMLTK